MTTTTQVYHTRSDDGAYRAWADSQMDCWYEELEEEEEEEEATFGNPKGEAAQ